MKHNSSNTSSTLAYILSQLFVVLFLYTVYHKAVGFGAFQQGIAQIPYIGTYPAAVAWGVLGAEVLVSLLLIWPDTNRLGLWGALGLMAAFTLYITATLLFAEVPPCPCGGAIEQLSWGQHLLFNSGFIALATGLLLHHYNKVNFKQLIHKIMTFNSKIRKATFGMLVAMLAVGFSAFTAAQNQSWYYDSGSATDPASYSDTPVANCVAPDDVICEIEAPEDSANPGQPDMDAIVDGTTETVEDQIEDALTGLTINQTVLSFRVE